MSMSSNLFSKPFVSYVSTGNRTDLSLTDDRSESVEDNNPERVNNSKKLILVAENNTVNQKITVRSKATVRNAFSAGMDEYITKPVKREELAAVLERLLVDDLSCQVS